MKLYDLILEYFDKYKYELKKRTLFNYYQNIRNYIKNDIGQCELQNMDNDKLNNSILSKYKGYGSNGTLSASTLKITKTIINQSLNYGYNKGYFQHNLKITVSFKQVNIPKIESFTNYEANIIEKDIRDNKRFYSYGVLLSLYTGLRIGELLALKWEDIDLKNKIMSIKTTTCDIAFENQMYHIEDTPKSASSLREVPLTLEIISMLKELQKFQNYNSKYVISRATGKQIKVRSYQDSFERLLKRLNIRHYGFHSLRHTFATRCYKLGMDIKTLSELLGHSNPAVTLKIYVHTDMDTKRLALTKITKKIRQQMPEDIRLISY